nr:IS30 family transposase [Peptoniphilus indolicus]
MGTNRGAIRKLRHRGKSRHTKNYEERRGKIVISNLITYRPQITNNRGRLRDWEADTVLGQVGKACLVTLTDRKSRYLLCKKISEKKSTEVKNAMIELLKDHSVENITPDRGKEFSKHLQINKELHLVKFYFPFPHHPWQRGTNVNTNGLLREYFPKIKDIDQTDEYVESKVQ